MSPICERILTEYQEAWEAFQRGLTTEEGEVAILAYPGQTDKWALWKVDDVELIDCRPVQKRPLHTRGKPASIKEWTPFGDAMITLHIDVSWDQEPDTSWVWGHFLGSISSQLQSLLKVTLPESVLGPPYEVTVFADERIKRFVAQVRYHGSAP